MTRQPETSLKKIVVDGQPKGEAFRKNGRWWWRRPSGSAEPFARGSKLEDVTDWARKCCNGKTVTAQ